MNYFGGEAPPGVLLSEADGDTLDLDGEGVVRLLAPADKVGIT
jgi:hypothetical protein